MADRRLIDANALHTELAMLQRYLDRYGTMRPDERGGWFTREEVLKELRAAPTIAVDDARLRDLIASRLIEQGYHPSDDSLANAIALAAADIMEYLGAKATE